ncbi:cation transporter [Persicitalea jodogahamensis]|uniref:Cation transporter n=2 Tax=Persicitalea jodogahamensis TaxID=402147 RepID=A0A8J3D9P5_9BACT|nr:cation transporter [Persicitalea jodogahamensis]
MTLQQSEDAFRQNNLLLLAEQYNINVAQAGIIQARIWELPYVSVELNALNPPQQRILDVGGKGQKQLAVQQLIYMGGKKKNEIEFAKSNVGLAELQFEQLVRNLRFQLRQQYFSLYFDLRKIESITSQVARVDTLIQAYTVQVQKGNIPLKDQVRLQSLALSLRDDLVSLQSDVFEEQRQLSLLTGTTEPIVPVLAERELVERYEKAITPNVDELLELAKESNPDYRRFLKLMENNELYARWQRSLATPDLTAGVSYDQRGGAFNNQVNLTFGLPLPLWNRNRGTIKIAEWQLNQSRLLKDFQLEDIRNQIVASLRTWEQQSLRYRQLATSTQNFDLVYNSIVQNFRRGNISILEFTDFMESYNQSILQMIELRKQLILSEENVNQVINATVF